MIRRSGSPEIDKTTVALGATALSDASPRSFVDAMLTFILIAGIRARGDFAAANILTWTFVAGFAVLTLAMAIFYVRMERLDRG